MKKIELKNLNLEDWPIPNEFLTELGRISALWTSLEWMLENYIGKLAGFNSPGDPKPFILLRHTTFPQKLDILSALCDKLAPHFPHLEDYKNVLSCIKTAQTFRNKYIHNGLGFDPKTKKATLSIGSARGSVKASVEEIDVFDIRYASIAINEAMVNLHKLITRKEILPVSQTRKVK